MLYNRVHQLRAMSNKNHVQISNDYQEFQESMKMEEQIFLNNYRMNELFWKIFSPSNKSAIAIFAIRKNDGEWSLLSRKSAKRTSKLPKTVVNIRMAKPIHAAGDISGFCIIGTTVWAIAKAVVLLIDLETL